MTEGIKGPKDHEGHKVSSEPLNTETPGQANFQKAMDTPVRTLGDMKLLLIKSLGHEKGKKLYNKFLEGLVGSMLSQIRQTQQQADQATKQMGQNQ